MDFLTGWYCIDPGIPVCDEEKSSSGSGIKVFEKNKNVFEASGENPCPMPFLLVLF